ncbi:protein kinase [Pseudoflavitalea sp. X16]|uniref:protein kinase domain-containing protein n=1 Tax=Paraflavitalea devenefica TaxID=2716334 RepID=UPI00142443E8|nr:lanthionine synthetase LanC family protein [Paraflavitalea devenefica]NII29859.1 protein kinase [Paraflavitalea devenefica]
MKSTSIVITSEISMENQSLPAKGKAEKRAGNRVGYHYIILKSFKESTKNDVVKCWYIKGLLNFGVCVIKEGSLGDSKDRSGRDIIDRLKWQKHLHESLQDKVRIPRLLGSFEENGNYYLVIEFIAGRPLHTLLAEKRKAERQNVFARQGVDKRLAGYLVQAAEILEKLHRVGIVHRDFTPNNLLITGRRKVALIDMELSYSLRQQFPQPVFTLGTYGYMSPQQEAMQVPTKAEDIYALGAILFLAWSGVAPAKVLRESWDSVQKKLPFFIADKHIAELIGQCLSPEVAIRPDAATIAGTLRQYKADLIKGTARPLNSTITVSKEEIMVAATSALQAMCSPLMADPEKGWFAVDMKASPKEDKSKLQKAWYASFNRGASGIIYLLARAKQVGLDTGSAQPLIEKGLDFIATKYINRIGQATTGLHFGADGIAAALATAMDAELIESSPTYQRWVTQLLQKANPAISIAHGAAGQGMAVLLSGGHLPWHTYHALLQKYAEVLIQRQQKDGSWINGYYTARFGRKKARVTRGFLSGMAGQIAFLLEYGHLLQHEPSMEAARQGLYWLLGQARPKKGTLLWRSSQGKALSYSFSDGIAGVALAFIKGYEYTREETFGKAASATLHALPVNLTDNGLSQDTGLAGLGEVYLEAFRVLRENHWQQRADWIAQVIMQLRQVHPQHGDYWLVEGERQPVANFMVGNSGVIHFLLRYCQPAVLGLPLFPTTSLPSS